MRTSTVWVLMGMIKPVPAGVRFFHSAGGDHPDDRAILYPIITAAGSTGVVRRDSSPSTWRSA